MRLGKGFRPCNQGFAQGVAEEKHPQDGAPGRDGRDDNLEVVIALIAAGGSIMAMYVLGSTLGKSLVAGSETLAQAHQAGLTSMSTSIQEGLSAVAQAHQAGLAAHGAAIKEAAQPVAWGFGTAAWGLAAAGTGLLGRMLAKLKGPTS